MRSGHWDECHGYLQGLNNGAGPDVGQMHPLFGKHLNKTTKEASKWEYPEAIVFPFQFLVHFLGKKENMGGAQSLEMILLWKRVLVGGYVYVRVREVTLRWREREVSVCLFDRKRPFALKAIDYGRLPLFLTHVAVCIEHIEFYFFFSFFIFRFMCLEFVIVRTNSKRKERNCFQLFPF